MAGGGWGTEVLVDLDDPAVIGTVVLEGGTT